jgi:hypothetical protein
MGPPHAGPFGACIVTLSFWITLTLLDYQATPSTRSMAPEEGAAGGSAPSRTIRLFDERSSRLDGLTATWHAAEAPDGSRTAILMEDRSKIYGNIVQEVPVGNDARTHTISIDFKTDSSPIAEMVMVYQGGGQQKTYYAFVHLNNPSEDMLPTGEGQISSKFQRVRSQQRFGKYQAVREALSAAWRSAGYGHLLIANPIVE